MCESMPSRCSGIELIDLLFYTVQFEHSAVHKEMTREKERSEKLEKKLGVITHGYVIREKKLKETIEQAWNTLEASCFTGSS